MTQHAELGASSAARWMNCSGSVLLSRPFEGRTSVYAAEGTAAHAFAEAALLRQPMPSVGHLVDVDDHKILVTQEMVDAVEMYVAFCRNLVEEADWEVIEQKVAISSVPPPAECYGTVDFAAVVHRTLHVVDLKFGKGVIVNVEQNPQALFYALGVYETFLERSPNLPIDEIAIHIIQPRVDGAKEKTWVIDLIDLLIWRDSQLLPAVQRIVNADQSLQDGPWCRFCPALAACPLKHDLAQEAARMAFTDDLRNTGDIDAVGLAERLQLGLRLADWIEALQKEATAAIYRGETVPGFKIVEGRSLRKWADDDDKIWKRLVERGDIRPADAEHYFEPPQLKSPAQMEKTLKRFHRDPAQVLNGLVVKPAGKPTLAPENDPRPPMQFLTAAEAFAQSAALEDP